MPKAHDMGDHRFQAISPPPLLKKMPLGKAMDENPHLIMDIITSEDARHSAYHAAPRKDMRPNRSMTRYTRTSRVVRHSGVQNSMVHRDDVMRKAEAKAAQQKSLHAAPDIDNTAATVIQRIWRKWHTYCRENSEWMTVTWVCA